MASGSAHGPGPAPVSSFLELPHRPHCQREERSEKGVGNAVGGKVVERDERYKVSNEPARWELLGPGEEQLPIPRWRT